MNRTLDVALRAAVASVLALGATACRGRTTAEPADPVPTTTEPARTPTEPLRLDCTDGACAPIEVLGDEPFRLADDDRGNYSGFADPSLAADPSSDRIWMTYSWPHVDIDGRRRVPGVEVHLAASDDGGATWRSEGAAFPARHADHPGDGRPGYVSSEVSDIAPLAALGDDRWAAVHLEYFVPVGGGYAARPLTSFVIKVAAAESPASLDGAPEVSIGSAITAAAWDVDVRLDRVHGDVADCQMWNEPSLHTDDDRLYLVLRCLRATRQERPLDLERTAFVVFSTSPTGAPRDWTWSYVGELANGDVGRALGGVGVSQLDVARGTDGQLLAILTPDSYDRERAEFVHHGCRVIEIAELSTPGVRLDDDGEPIVRAEIIAGDLEPFGPGACGYDASSATGVVFTRRDLAPDHLFASLHATGLRP